MASAQVAWCGCCNEGGAQVTSQARALGAHTRKLPAERPKAWCAQVAWCAFQGEGEALVMLQAGALGAYSPAGELQTVPLPAGFTAMWALPQGLLLTARRQPAPPPNPTLPYAVPVLCKTLMLCSSGACLPVCITLCALPGTRSTV